MRRTQQHNVAYPSLGAADSPTSRGRAAVRVLRENQFLLVHSIHEILALTQVAETGWPLRITFSQKLALCSLQ